MGDDLMESSKVYEYFSEFCSLNGYGDVNVHYKTIEDARMYTYADMCENDGEFRALVEKADVILFEEGTAETLTTVESVSTILSYADDPMVVCISYYGYPRWLHRNLFLKSHPYFRYADANTVIGSIIAAEDALIGFEHLYHDDYIHPNELNGFITALICYCKVYEVDSADINWQGVETREKLMVGTPCVTVQDLKALLTTMQYKVDRYIN